MGATQTLDSGSYALPFLLFSLLWRLRVVDRSGNEQARGEPMSRMWHSDGICDEFNVMRDALPTTPARIHGINLTLTVGLHIRASITLNKNAHTLD